MSIEASIEKSILPFIGRSANDPLVLFSASLQASLVPETARGSNTATYTRATTATAWGFAANAVAGDFPLLLPIASGEARFVGARRISEGVWSTSLSDGAPINLSNTTLASLYADALGGFGYLAEGARTNIVVQNRTFENVAWTASVSMTVADDSAVGIDGLTRAATLTAGDANQTLIQDLGTISSAEHIGGFWVKRKTGTGDIQVTIDNGVSWTTRAITDEWTRIASVAKILADPDVGLRIVTSGDAVFIDHAQVEAAPFLSSDTQETTSSAVIRNADVLTYDDAGNFIDAAGTAFASVSTIWSAGVASTQSILRRVTGANWIMYVGNNAEPDELWNHDGTNTSTGVNGTSMFESPQRVASTWGAALTAFRPGDLSPDPSPASYDGTIGSGDLEVAATLFGTIRNVKIFDKELSANEVAAL